MGGLKLSEIKKHVMTGISFMIPIVVGAGLCMALGTAIGGTKVSEAEGTLIWYIWRTGKIGMGFVVPVITAAIAYSIADRHRKFIQDLSEALLRHFLWDIRCCS